MVHQFFIYSNKDRFDDHSCQSNCIYKYMLALDMEWIEVVNQSMALSKWEKVAWGKTRIEVREDEIVMRYRDKYNNLIVTEKGVEELKIAFKIYKRIKTLSNLKNQSPKTLKAKARELFKIETDRRLREMKTDI